MNLCDYYVHEVLKPPTFQEQSGYSWWEVEVSYYYDNDELKVRKLTFDTERAANQVNKGYHFTS